MRTPSMVLAYTVLAGILGLSSPALRQQKTIKACQEEWRANKEANQAKGITEKAYVSQCRTGSTAAQPTPAPAAPTATPATAPARTAPPAPARTTAAPAATVGSTGTNQFTTEAQAKARCPSDTVVWVNLSSKIYHFAGHKDYGTTKNGAYMCEKDSTAQGARAAKNEKRPG